MATILGKPMIGHVVERVQQCAMVTKTAVATCDPVIFDYVRSIGETAVMTAATHERASDRCAEALLMIERQEGCRFDIVVMVQGDEPMIHPEMIREALEPMIAEPSIQVVNLLGEIRNKEEFKDRNCIKVVCDLEGNAMYFSREPIPTENLSTNVPMGKQICIIPFQREFLLKYTCMSPTPLEKVESVDMLRILENGIKVRMVKTKYQTQSVDTLQDLKKVEVLLASQ